MKRKDFIILTLLVFVAAVSATLLVACERDGNTDEKTLYLPEAKDDKIETILHGNEHNVDESFIFELPPESFVGTVIEETTSYMIVEPNHDEDEYRNFGSRITVEYINDHIDYLYGKGRKVVITYLPTLYSDANPVIVTDDIRHDGFEEFELSVKYSNETRLRYVLNNSDIHEYSSDYNLYYYGLTDVFVNVDGATLPLEDALRYGKVTLDGIIADCRRRNALADYTLETVYKDGGSSLYNFGDYKIIKYHTLDGNRDVYIGTPDIDINVSNLTNTCINVSSRKDWGIRLEAKDVTPKGATLVYNHYSANETGSLQTGEWFRLERKDGNRWIELETNPLIDFAFHMVAYMINKDGSTELDVKWDWLYGDLEAGQYRIAKEVTDFRKTADFDEQIYYAYFEIPDRPAEEICGLPVNDENKEELN